MPVKIHGRNYRTVAERVNELHTDYKTKKLSVITELVSWTNGIVIMKATVTTNQGVFTGHAYEREDQGNINKTSALENCETSCIGRALASAGYAGAEFASANEVQTAIKQQKTPNLKPVGTVKLNGLAKELKALLNHAGLKADKAASKAVTEILATNADNEKLYKYHVRALEICETWDKKETK